MVKNKTEAICKKYANALSMEKLPIGEIDCNKLGLNIDEISWIVFNIKDFCKFLPSSDMNESQSLVKLYELIVGFGLTYYTNEEKAFSASDFPCTADNAVKCFQYCNHLLPVCKDLELSYKVKIIIKSLFLCATHSDLYAWSSENSKNSSLDFLESLLSFTSHDNLTSLLCDDNFYPTIFKRYLKEMCSCFKKGIWQRNPSNCYIFKWLLLQVKHPYLAEYLNEVFTPPHMFVLDSHETCHHVVAIECFTHILDNVPPTLMKLDNKADVIYDILKPYMHSWEKEIIISLVPCFLKLPDFKYQKMTSISWNKYDEFFNVLLNRAEMECKMHMKFTYIFHIDSFVQVLPPFKHLKHLWKIVENCLIKDSDVSCLLITLKILKDIIKCCSPRMHSYCFSILKCLAIFLDQLEQKFSDNIVLEEMYVLCEESLYLLKCASKDEFESIVSKYLGDAEDINIHTRKIFESAMEKPVL